MITRENIAEVLSNLDKAQIESAMDYPSDWVMIQLNIFNAGWYATINGVNYTEDLEEEVKGNGDFLPMLLCTSDWLHIDVCVARK